MKRDKNRLIVVPLMGGLGNQLFQFTAALHLRNIKGLNVAFADWTKSYSLCNTKRQLEIDVLIKEAHFQFQNVYPKSIARLVSIVNSNLVYWESSVGQNLPLAKIENQKIVVGFFQNANLVDSVGKNLLDLISNSNFLPGLIKEAPKNHVAVHVRYGDYLKNKKTRRFHGLMTEDYYINSVIELATELNLKDVLFVTDNTEQLHLDFHNFFSKTDLSITVSKSMNHFVDFVKIVNSRGIIMSNSSFSWWASWLGHKLYHSRVIIPRPWLSQCSNYDQGLVKETWTVRKRNTK